MHQALQQRKRVIRIDVREIAHALLLNEQALAGHQPHQAHDDLRQQRLHLFDARGTRWLEHRCALAIDPIHAVKHETMEVNI